MIKKSLSVAIILILTFEAFIRLSNFNWDTSQNDKSANLISAQNFIFNISENQLKNDTLIIGSSISRKLITASMGENYYNLAFNGWSSYDGLELVKLTQKKPACLLIEMNVVGEQVLQQDVVNSLSPTNYYPDKVFKSLQLKNQPVGLAIGYLKERFKGRIEELKKRKRENRDLYELNLKMRKEKFMDPLPDSVFEKRFTVLKALIDSFKKQNVGIVFFEAPFDEQLEQTETVLTTRKFFHQYFPVEEYKYIPLPSINNYTYSDGIHLDIESANAYTIYLRDRLNGLRE